MDKNKVEVFIDGVQTMALVDTGATVSIMSRAFKERIGHKVMFCWDRGAIFRGVGGEPLCPIGICTVDVSLAGKIFQAEFAVLSRSTHNVILGIDFLRECGALVDCATGELSISSLLHSALPEEPSLSEEHVLVVSEDILLPARSASLVPVMARGTGESTFRAVAEPIMSNCVKKDVLLPHCLISVDGGRSVLWAVNCSAASTVLPREMKLAVYERDVTLPLAAVSDEDCDFGKSCATLHGEFLKMINKGLSSTEREALRLVLAKHASVFDFFQGQTKTEMPACRTRHTIDTGTASPVRQKPYRVSPSERRVIADQVNEMLQKGVVRESASPWAAPVILVKKKDGSWRFCVDYRRLNAITKKDVYPLPRIDDVIDCLHSASYFSSVDLRSGYWQIPVDPAHKEKTAFVTPDGLFEFNVMPFGLCNAPATFERFMDTILRGLKWEICLCYLDDVVIFGRTFEEHNTRLDIVLNCLGKAGLVLNSKKCRFGESQTLVLGHLVDKDGVRPDPEKVAAVSHFKQPQSVRDLRSFLGLCSYFRRFVPKFAELAAPLSYLLRKNVPFNWTPECEASFSQLKFLLTSGPILRHFDPSASTEVHTDASSIGVGAVLVQRHQGAQHVIAYASRTLSRAESNYTVTEQECLAVIFAVHKFRPYIYGRPFTIVTDHHSLCWLVGLRDPSGRLARWALRLQEYDFVVSYKSGRRHTDADCLSRLPVSTTACDADNFDDYLATVSESFPDVETFRREQQNDSKLTPFFAAARESAASNRFYLRDGLLYKANYGAAGARFLLVVPERLRPYVLRAMHDDLTSGHLGFARTLHRAQERFYWPNMRRTTEKYVATCTECQRYKRPPAAPPGLLHPVQPPTAPFEQVGIDLVGPLPRTPAGNRWVIVCVNHLTRYTETTAVPTASASSVSVFLLNCVILRHGAPRVVISDRGRQFVADVVEELLRLCTSQFRHATPYHPQTNGLVERTNRTLLTMISMYVSSDHRNWDDILPFITYAYNTAQHETTGYSPFYLVYARSPRTPLDTILPFSLHNDASVARTLCLAEESRQLARLRTLSSQGRSKDRYDARHRRVAYCKGDLVLLWTPLRKRGLCTKFLSRYTGPFVVLDRVSDVTYVISRLTTNGRRSSKTQLVHVARLKTYHPRAAE